MAGLHIHPLLLMVAMLFLLMSINKYNGARAQLKTHSQFLKARYKSTGLVGCARNTSVCTDPDKNPSASATSICCFNTICKDVSSDRLHCGKCGNTCPFGLSCCGGLCVDIKFDPQHCGSCFYECPKNEKCSFGMCGYS